MHITKHAHAEKLQRTTSKAVRNLRNACARNVGRGNEEALTHLGERARQRVSKEGACTEYTRIEPKLTIACIKALGEEIVTVGYSPEFVRSRYGPAGGHGSSPPRWPAC